MSEPNAKCHHPLPDGSLCHSCRVFEALVAAERIVEPEAVRAGYLNIERCLAGLADSMAAFIADDDSEEALRYLAHVFALSREYRRDTERRETATHSPGHA